MPIIKSDWWVWTAPIGNQIAIATLPVVATVVLPAVKATGNLTVVGDVIVGGDIHPGTGIITLADGPITIAGNTDNPGLVTDVVLSQNAEVLGTLTVDGTLVATGGVTGPLAVTGALSAASVATAEGDIRHGPKILHYGPADMHPAVGAPTYVGGATVNTGWQSTAAADAVDFDVEGLAVGDRVLSVWVYGTATAAQQWSATLFQLNLFTGAAVTLGTVNSTVGVVRRAKQVFNGAFTMPADTVLRVQWVSVAAGGMTIHGGECQFDRV